MWASGRCLLKTFLYSWLYYKDRACRMTSSLLRGRLDWTMGTLDLRPHTYSFTSFPDDLWILSNHFSWNTSLFPPQNYPSSSQGIALSESKNTSQVFKKGIQQNWDTFSSACQEPDFVNYTLYIKSLCYLLSQYSGECIWIILNSENAVGNIVLFGNSKLWNTSAKSTL